MDNPTPMRTPEEIAKEIVKRFRENERVHTEEWDESRYLEKKIASAIRTERKEVDALKSALKEAGEALGYAEEYFDQRANAQYFPNSPAPVPNTEMAHLVLIRAALSKIKKELGR